MTKVVKRLYQTYHPQHYIVNLSPDRQVKTFTGTVIMSGRCVGRPSQRLTLHQKGLKVHAAHVTRHDKKGDEDIPIDRINHHHGVDEVRLHAKQLLYPGLFTIRLEFSGVITRNMNGMYPCFFEQDGKLQELIATQFESHHAREVFPCIDEPEAKATFDLCLTTPEGDTVLANTPVKSQKTADQLTTTTFETTPHMSTYLLAFVYGPLDYQEATTKDGVAVRTYATPDNVKLTDFALEVAVKCLEFYNDYFGLSYPLPKCDLIALPDFASGAMENWGCITFREQCMLVDPKNSTLATKQYVAMVVAHELAHQWFGNLVTMRWWTDLWLNEGFASWIEYLAIDKLFPDWNMWTQFVVDEQQQALRLDALEHTHPIEVPVNHPDEIRTIFDTISYSKGSSIINMLHEYLTPEVFRRGLRHYLQQHKYGSTDTIDLWNALESVSGKPVANFMRHWTEQAGFPLISAQIEEQVGIKLSQQRFYLNPQHTNVSEHPWPVALLSQHESLPELMTTASLDIPITDTNDFKLNRGQSGFYRVAYNASHLQQLGGLISKGHLPVLERIGILTDLIESAKAGHIDTIEALYFLQNFNAESDYTVWDVLASFVGSIHVVMGDDKLRDAMKPFIRSLIRIQLKRLGWNRQKTDTHFDQLLRPIILSMAASADEPGIPEKCQQLFDNTDVADEIDSDLRQVDSPDKLKRGDDIDPDLRGTVFGTVARLGDQTTFNKLLKLHNQATLSEERVTLSAALTGFRHPSINKQSLQLIASDNVRLQDAAYWIAYSFMNRHARHATWEWLKVNWEWLRTNLGTDMSFSRLPLYVARVFTGQDFINDYNQFFLQHMSPDLDRSFKQGLEILAWQTAWKERDSKAVMHFFSSYNV